MVNLTLLGAAKKATKPVRGNSITLYLRLPTARVDSARVCILPVLSSRGVKLKKLGYIFLTIDNFSSIVKFLKTFCTKKSLIYKQSRERTASIKRLIPEGSAKNFAEIGQKNGCVLRSCLIENGRIYYEI